MNVYFYTFGCKVNQYETEHLREELLSRGYKISDSPQGADICIVNSCTVTGEADRKCRQLVRRVRRESPDCILVLTGCLPQAAEDGGDSFLECDIVTGNGGKERLPELIEGYLDRRERILLGRCREETSPLCAVNRVNSGKTRSYIKIQDGCDRYCTYCAIPRARGALRSKPLEIIRQEAAELIANGHKELILTGINLCRYGADIGGATLADAVKAVDGLEGEFRVRLSSVEPDIMTDGELDELAGCKRLCPHFHLSMQSGCDETLRRMNRRYTSEEYYSICRKLRQRFEGCAITTDIMVGFPGETEEEFRQSLGFVKRVGFAEAHIFPYSRRPGTAADKMKGQLSRQEKQERAARMTALCNELRQRYLQEQVGRRLTVLFERESEREFHCGHSENYVTVKVKRETEGSLWKQMKTVRIISAEDSFCLGETEE
ncbi:MAG: tRNA (N(6)-L-threonylcarbamoyladenosine(37)-C(2))-methylthiotransferase MtaB [Ruminococcus sp.]|nr:tRNA (N(6)-L-threonylcarbamoyladenosine(37)-C(2))-methylthiotransferase MtaB [Ruminococcus sp.]